MLVNTKNSPKNYLPTKFFVRRLHAWGLSICTWYPQTNYMKCSIDESWVNIEMFICHIYSHNSFQHHCGNWETIIRELCPKWCLNKKIIMKKKKKRPEKHCWLRVKMGIGIKDKQWFCIVPSERLYKLSIEHKCNFRYLIIWDFLSWRPK